VSWENAQTKQSNGLFGSDMVNFLKRFLVTLFMAISWVILALCIHLSPASGADPSVMGRSQAGEHFNGYGADEGAQDVPNLSGNYPDSRDISMSIGRTAFESRDYESAVTAFDRALSDLPDISATGLSFNGGSFKPGSLKATQQSLQKALALNPQQDVQTNIDKYLQTIESSKKEHFLSARIALGLDFDDNANPAGAGIGMTTSLNDAISVTVDRPEKGQKHTSTASFDYLYRPRGSMVSWKFSGMNYAAVYREDRDLDVNLYDFKAGTSIERDNVTWDIYGTTNHLNHDCGQYLRTYGAGTTLNYAFTSRFRLSVDGKFKAKNYFEDSDKDARNISLAVSPIFASGRSRISLSVGMELENAREDINTYTKFNGNATYEVVLPFASSAYVSYWYQGTGYKDANPLVDKGRIDEVHYISTGFSKSIPVWKSIPKKLEMDLNLNYTYTRSDSNIDLYAYTKNVLSSGMSVAF
jgi:outer membrane protein